MGRTSLLSPFKLLSVVANNSLKNCSSPNFSPCLASKSNNTLFKLLPLLVRYDFVISCVRTRSSCDIYANPKPGISVITRAGPD